MHLDDASIEEGALLPQHAPRARVGHVGIHEVAVGRSRPGLHGSRDVQPRHDLALDAEASAACAGAAASWNCRAWAPRSARAAATTTTWRRMAPAPAGHGAVSKSLPRSSGGPEHGGGSSFSN
eukprot:CAMPEP_0195063406 /NCGR_PEP_ID=MMETSP0448-20130528/9784_1 /TAXON_ID=66468 /ORGANISM="Heterocapsa triquestra, Strain CCMP 448" /LENGTH=122 /DNA_ID=CAMNT_0040094275 /DNA_START=100 /DNA_END=469 /DNA_ORIENTATION=-